MQKVTHGLGAALLLVIGTLSACQRNAPPKPTMLPTDQRVAQSVQLSPSPAPTQISSPVPTATATSSATATVTPSPTITPTRTPTPVPSERLAAARQAFEWGDYHRAQREYSALLGDPAVEESERRLV